MLRDRKRKLCSLACLLTYTGPALHVRLLPKNDLPLAIDLSSPALPLQVPALCGEGGSNIVRYGASRCY